MLNTQAYTRLSAALPKLTAEDVIDMGPVLVKIIPELKPTLGFDQHSPHHKYDLFTHIAHVVGNVPPDLTVRWAALLGALGEADTRRVLKRLRCSNACIEETAVLVRETAGESVCGSFSEDRPLGWDPVAAGNRAGDGMARFVSEEKAADGAS